MHCLLFELEGEAVVTVTSDSSDLQKRPPQSLVKETKPPPSTCLVSSSGLLSFSSPRHVSSSLTICPLSPFSPPTSLFTCSGNCTYFPSRYLRVDLWHASRGCVNKIKELLLFFSHSWKMTGTLLHLIRKSKIKHGCYDAVLLPASCW